MLSDGFWGIKGVNNIYGWFRLNQDPISQGVMVLTLLVALTAKYRRWFLFIASEQLTGHGVA